MSSDTDISDLPVPAETDISDLPAPPQSGGWWSAVKGVGQAGLALGAGALKSINTAANNLLPGEAGRTAMQAEIEKDPILNYHGGPEAQPILGAINQVTAPARAIGSAIHQGLSDLAGPRTADVLGDLVTLAPAARGVFSKLPAEAEIEEGHPLSGAAQEERGRLADIQSRAEKAGYQLPEGGTAQAHADAAAVNRPLVNAAARTELNLPKNADLTPEMLARARSVNASPAYKAVEELPEPITLNTTHEATMRDVGDLLPARIRARVPESGEITGQQAVELSKMLRNRAAQLDKTTGVTAAGDTYSELASAHRDLAESIEDSVRDHLAQSGRESLADNWDAARVYTAKSYSVQSALDGAGNVRASDLKTQLFKKGKPLSGSLEDIANLAARYPEAFRTSRVTQPGVGIVRKGIAAAAPVIGGTVGGWVGGPIGAGMGTASGEYGAQKLLQNR